MRPFSPFSRKPLLLIGFVSVFVILYNIASHPQVSKSMRPTAYYDNYDEPACLPEKLLQTKPPREKAKAAMVILVRNSEQEAIAETIVNFQDKFNKNFNYPYVFLNNDLFTDEFKTAMKLAAPNAEMSFGLVPQDHWGYPPWVNETLAAESRKQMDADNNNKQYGFVVTLTELKETIPTLWKTVREYAYSRRINITSNPQLLFPFFEDEQGDYNLCHFWSNFEIASLNLWRSPAYRDFFNYLDQTGKFFYERWGDAPVHSIAAGLFLETDQVHYFEDIGYQHDLYRHCPSTASGKGCRCDCPEGTNDKSIDHDQYPDSCLPKWKNWVETSKARKAHWMWT
ncbi:nucleotide-diphospho-sugar transferase [Phycomyces blakesleeanus]|uniref:Nucleotide-diphospho-sugar transferase n=1 Tax=Phycomyces blakesleeanus TaxID=4837 RepID=A0ABR3BFE0_PHYBL